MNRPKAYFGLDNTDVMANCIPRKNRRNTLGNDDCMVGITTGGKSDRLRGYVTFNDGIAEMILGECKYLAVAPHRNRIYVIPTDDPSIGFTASFLVNSTHRQVKFTLYSDEVTELFKSLSGNHELKYSNDRNLFYVGE